tara:strand:- start:2053 stop:2667 length:615 start_codon:yes stop_codon:yes gene_type:complete
LGTEGERTAGNYIREELEKSGFGVTAERFSCSEHAWKFVRISLDLIALAFLTESKIRDFDPGIAIAVSGFPFVLAILALRGLPRILNYFSDHPSIGPESFNLVTGRVGEGRHKAYRYPSECCALCAFSSFLSLLIHDIQSDYSDGLNAYWTVPASCTGLICTLALLSLKATNHSPGALNNASGVGVLLELAHSLSSKTRTQRWR